MWRCDLDGGRVVVLAGALSCGHSRRYRLRRGTGVEGLVVVKDVTVRAAEPADAPVVSELVATATAKLWGQPPPADEVSVEAEWRRRIVDDEFEVFVADLDGQVVGEIALTDTWHVPGSAHLSSVAVRFDLWDEGVARALLEHARAHLRQHGYKVVECWTEADNPRSVRLYERDGWTRRDERRWHPESGRWLIHFERHL